MKKVIGVIAGLLAALQLAALPAQAQDNTRNWDEGTVWWVSHVHTKPNQMNAYVNDLNNVWRKFLEKQKEEGAVISYGMYSNVNPREGEPDLYLTVTYKDWATFDRGVEYFEKISNEIMGSMENMREANIDRGELRTIGSTYTLRELKFKD